MLEKGKNREVKGDKFDLFIENKKLQQSISPSEVLIGTVIIY